MATQIEGLNSKHLAAGSTEPPNQASGKIRLYNMRFCPYGQRALLGLKLKQVPFEVVNINLKNKPEWYLQKKNPLGKVPTVEQDGKIVYESLVVVDYLNDTFSTGRSYVTKDPFDRAQQRMLTERLSALPSAIYPFYRNTQDPSLFANLEKALQLYESLLQKNYFGGDQPGYADFMSWPWVERLSAVEILSKGVHKIDQQKFPKLVAYIERMKAIPEIKEFLLDGPTHAKFIEAAFTKETLDYDSFL